MINEASGLRSWPYQLTKRSDEEESEGKACLTSLHPKSGSDPNGEGSQYSKSLMISDSNDYSISIYSEEEKYY